ncbi:hypothetical protein B0H13DRAFT_2099872 [Mycena leptocephala]|nr:hypothetical protein B0H13DRAFT_2099872 [Mycena leptocephala]
MLSVDGESYHCGQYRPRYQHSPASTSENTVSPVAARPAPLRVESQHAPASVTPARPSEEVVAVAEAPSIPDPSSAEITSLVDKIVASKTLEVDSSEFIVEPDIWPALALALPEDLGARLHYSSTTRTLIVTWPSSVHESFVWISDVFAEAKKRDSSLISITNTAIPFEGEFQGDTSTPDFALGRRTSDGEKYYIIIEAATRKLRKTWKPLQQNISYVPKSHPLTQSAFIQATRATASLELLGPVKIGDTTWGPAINRIMLTIWMQRDRPDGSFERKAWDITPIDNQIDHPDLLARHAQVDKLIRGISRAVIAQPTFSLAYPDKNSFRINWTGFYKDLPQRMLADSWARWLQWAARSLPKPVPPPVQLKFHDLSDENLENLRKRGRKFYVSDSDDEEEATGSIKRQRKQQKLEQ